MEISNLIPHIEALIFASEKPLTTLEITELINNAFGFMEDKITLDQIESALEGILEKYRAEFYPFEVRESGGGWQFLTKRDYHKTVAQLNGDKFLKRLSTAALETLSIIAYKQPVTKSEIESIRGVSSDYAIQKLLEKDLIVITGRNEKLPGHPLVYATSKNFMDYFGLNSADDLPKLKEVFDESFVAPTMMGEEGAAADAAAYTDATDVAEEAGEVNTSDPDMHEPSSNGVGYNEIDMVVEEGSAEEGEFEEEGEAEAIDAEDADDAELNEEDEEDMDEVDAAFSEEEDNAIYHVGEDGELIKEDPSPDEPSGEDPDKDDKPDEEKE
jgi:segregation and condensation protein B